MTPRSSRRFRIGAAVAVPLLFLVSLLGWSLASPIGSSPDDNFHLASIWCGLGERDGVCEASGDPDTRLVPTEVVNAPCYAFDADTSAQCQLRDHSGLAEAPWMNAVGLYPPLFYATMGLLVGPDVETSVLLMRFLNSALVVGLLAGTFFALPRRLRPALLISALATSVPLGLFVIASTNPSSWAYASALTVWITLLGALHSTGRRQLVLAGLAVGAALLGAGARADASAFAILAVGLAGVLGVRRSRNLLVPGIAAVLIVAVSVAFFLTSGQSRSLSSGLPTLNPPLTAEQHFENLIGIPNLWFGALGGWGLGWLDTLMPALVPTLAFAVFAAAAFIGIHRLSWRRGVAVSSALAAMWLVPFVLLAQSRAVVGSEVQPRYVLPLMAIFVGVAAASALAATQWRGVRMAAAGAALTVAMSLALHVNIRRYTVGADDNALDPGARAEWWWGAAPAPIIVWGVAGAAFAAAIVLLWLVNGKGEPAIAGSRSTAASDEARLGAPGPQEPHPSGPDHRRVDATVP